jgi:hypothetical protein
MFMDLQKDFFFFVHFNKHHFFIFFKFFFLVNHYKCSILFFLKVDHSLRFSYFECMDINFEISMSNHFSNYKFNFDFLKHVILRWFLLLYTVPSTE